MSNYNPDPAAIAACIDHIRENEPVTDVTELQVQRIGSSGSERFARLLRIAERDGFARYLPTVGWVANYTQEAGDDRMRAICAMHRERKHYIVRKRSATDQPFDRTPVRVQPERSGEADSIVDCVSCGERIGWDADDRSPPHCIPYCGN